MKTLLIVAALLAMNSCTNSFMPEIEKEMKLSVTFLEGLWSEEISSGDKIPMTYRFRADSSYRLVLESINEKSGKKVSTIFNGTFEVVDSVEIFCTFYDSVDQKYYFNKLHIEIKGFNEITISGKAYKRQ